MYSSRESFKANSEDKPFKAYIYFTSLFVFSLSALFIEKSSSLGVNSDELFCSARRIIGVKHCKICFAKGTKKTMAETKSSKPQ
jgi:hypothetical protein